MLEAIGAGVTPRIGYRDWKDVWLDSQEFQQVREEINAIKQAGLSRPESDSKSSGTCTFTRTNWYHYPNFLFFRCDLFLVSVGRSRPTKQPGVVEITRVYFYSSFHFRLRLAICFVVIIAAWEQ